MTETTSPVIEKNITIDATAERVWTLVSEPGWWINEGAYRDHVIEQRGDLYLVTDDKHGTFPLTIELSEAPRHIAYRWMWPSDQPGVDAPGTLTQFWIDDLPEGGVSLRVRESGFEELGKSESELRRHIDDNTSGWTMELAVAARHCES